MKLITFPRFQISTTLIKIGICAVTLLLAAFFGAYTSPLRVGLIVLSMGAVVLIQWPLLRFLALVAATLIARFEIGTGSEVALNLATLLVPTLFVLWLLDGVFRREIRLVPSRANRPLFLFLLAALFSLLIGNALWDPAVPRPSRFILVQLAQWAIFAFSAIAFWLTGNMARDETWLRRVTFFFLILAGSLAIIRVTPIPGAAGLVNRLTTVALGRVPFWLLLAALAGGQLLFNQELSTGWRLYLAVVLIAVLFCVFFLLRETASYWVSVAAVVGVLAWLRWPRLRWPVIVLMAVLLLTGILSSAVYEFGGGDAEWEESGGSRLVLIGRVVEVSMRNPITGIGPASYRPYTMMKPLSYGGAYWVVPRINSHNNYVDLFSQVGVLGLGVFFWFAVEVILLGLRLRSRYTQGFAAGYLNGMLAAWAGALVVMLLADWILPFVYNIGFPGFQASLLVWLFLGGLVALEQMANRNSGD